MKKKGFTLIELLAVILILAIIAVIVTPIISKIIDEAKTQADKRSAEKFVRAAQTYYVEAQVDEYKKDRLGTNIIEELDLENVDATGAVVANLDGTTEMAIVIGKKCFTKTATQEIKDIQVSKDVENCYAVSSGVAITNINSGSDSIVITLDDSNPSITITSCKFGTERSSDPNDGTIEGYTCTLAPVENGKRYYYEITFSDGSTKTGSIQAGVGDVTPSTGGTGGSTDGNGGSGSGGSGSGNGGSGSGGSGGSGSGGSGGSGSGGSGGTGVAGSVIEEANGRTVYTGRYLPNVVQKYFNVTTGTKCDIIDFSTNGGNTANGMNSGCLKFWAYMEDDVSYTMILDRNLDNSAYAWASSENNGVGPVTAADKLKELTDSWQGTITPKNYINVYMSNGSEVAYRIPYGNDGYKARFITTDEIAHITGNTTFNSVSSGTGDWFYLDGGTSASTGQTWQTQIATSSEQSAYKWLYNYTRKCIQSGCSSEGAVSGYWTSDAIAGTTDRAWIVTTEGRIYGVYFYRYDYNPDVTVSNQNDFGIRPVITVLKSALN